LESPPEQIQCERVELPIHYYYQSKADMSDNRFTYMSAGALASRRIIEQSSYATTPSRSPGDATPACGESIYKCDLGEENIKKVDSILEAERTIDGKNAKLQNDKTTFTSESPKNEPPACHILTKIRPKSEPLDHSIAKTPEGERVSR
jgi:hypothetical protein